MSAVDANRKSRRTYDSSKRREHARQQYETTLVQARRLFLERGYAATTVEAIAQAAEVSPATIYKTYGGKAALVRSLCEQALAGDGPAPAETRADALRAGNDPRQLIEGWADLLAEVSPRISPLMLLLRAAAEVDREAADTAAEQGAAEVEATEQQARAEAEAEAAPDEVTDAGPAQDEPAGPSAPALVYRPAPVSVPPVGGYELRLLTSRKLYDLATGTQASGHLAGLVGDAEVHLHPYDFDRLGVTAGSPVTVSNRERGRGQVAVPVHPSASVPRGSAFLRFNVPGASAAELIDAGSVVTDVRVEVPR